MGRGNLFYGHTWKVYHHNDPIFASDIYVLQDVLFYVLQDAGADPSPEDVYEHYLHDIHVSGLPYYWLVDFDTFLSGVKEFFDAYLPIAMESSRVTSE